MAAEVPVGGDVSKKREEVGISPKVNAIALCIRPVFSFGFVVAVPVAEQGIKLFFVLDGGNEMDVFSPLFLDPGRYADVQLRCPNQAIFNDLRVFPWAPDRHRDPFDSLEAVGFRNASEQVRRCRLGELKRSAS